MSVTKIPYGTPVKLLVEFQGFPDGRLVLFEIWKKTDSEEEKVTEAYGVTKEGKGVGWWVPTPKERKGNLSLEKNVSQKVKEEKYYFIAKIDDQNVKSEDLVFAYSLDIYLEEETGKPLDGAACTITFSDGSKKKGVFRNGHSEFEKAPPGRFKLELKQYEFIFKD